MRIFYHKIDPTVFVTIFGAWQRSTPWNQGLTSAALWDFALFPQRTAEVGLDKTTPSSPGGWEGGREKRVGVMRVFNAAATMDSTFFDIPPLQGIYFHLHYERSGHRPGSATWDGHPRCPLALRSEDAVAPGDN
jgi:hypothetical protein